MGRIFFVWLIATLLCGGFVYALNFKEKLFSMKMFWRVVVAMILGAIVAFAPLVLNNIQGI